MKQATLKGFLVFFKGVVPVEDLDFIVEFLQFFIDLQQHLVKLLLFSLGVPD